MHICTVHEWWSIGVRTLVETHSRGIDKRRISPRRFINRERLRHFNVLAAITTDSLRILKCGSTNYSRTQSAQARYISVHWQHKYKSLLSRRYSSQPRNLNVIYLQRTSSSSYKPGSGMTSVISIYVIIVINKNVETSSFAFGISLQNQ